MTVSAKDILGITKSVTKKWTKQRKAEERGRRSRSSRQYVYSYRVNFTEVADNILPSAYAHASGNGTYTVAKRQLYYACRQQFLDQTGRELKYDYFAGTLLVQYMNRHPGETASWKVTADPRGTLTIPNAGHEERIPCGTIQIDNHLKEASESLDPFKFDAGLPVEWPSLKAGQRYQAVLYIEKEGFEPLLREAMIAELFDLAILSCKGQSVVAARRFIDRVCSFYGVPLFVVHDFDKAGFEISQCLTRVSAWAKANDRVTYRFLNTINVTDLGLRLEDVQQYDLDDEGCEFNGRFARDSICTDAEKEFLLSGRRVELNSFTSPEFIEWIEAKLTEHLGSKRLVPADDVLENAYRRARAVAEVNAVIANASKSAIKNAKSAKVSKTLRQQLKKKMKDTPEAWDKALYDMVFSKLYPDSDK